VSALADLARAHLGRRERAWAEAIFAAILAPETAGLPAFDSIDRDAFWRCLDQAPGVLLGHGLRAMIHTVTFLPLTDRRYRRPFFALPLEARLTVVAELDHHPRFLLRQTLETLKLLACFAYFDDAAVRARFPGPRP